MGQLARVNCKAQLPEPFVEVSKLKGGVRRIPEGRNDKAWMLMKNAQMLDMYPLSKCVKIGDTVVYMEEGKNAGMWTIGLTRTGNLVGLDREQWERLPAQKKKAKLDRAKNILLKAGADFVAEDLASCNPALAKIESRLSSRK